MVSLTGTESEQDNEATETDSIPEVVTDGITDSVNGVPIETID